ncbi:hypothetical protein L6452_39664 [Arctium lappa]|uniref:Uncharacterized protein n=1 Tax=Arctium lappa TaxID=4217 RepID=A0ACB8XTM5_ARCLA|nr:hypothetical protein L6452_39664 [Arctium lappa]
MQDITLIYKHVEGIFVIDWTQGTLAVDDSYPYSSATDSDHIKRSWRNELAVVTEIFRLDSAFILEVQITHSSEGSPLPYQEQKWGKRHENRSIFELQYVQAEYHLELEKYAYGRRYLKDPNEKPKDYVAAATASA